MRATDAAVDAAVARRAAVPDEPDGRSAVVRAGVAALAAAGIAARPLAELLEPLPTAPPAGLAAVERLLGDELLEALVVAPDDRARAQAALVAAQAAARLVVATSASARLPAWAAWFVDGLAGTLAGRALATALARLQPYVLRPMTWFVLTWEVGFAAFVGLLWLREATGKRWFPDLRRYWLGFGALMHLGIWAMMYVVWFTPLVLAAYTAFLRPEEAARVVARVRARLGRRA